MLCSYLGSAWLDRWLGHCVVFNFHKERRYTSYAQTIVALCAVRSLCVLALARRSYGIDARRVPASRSRPGQSVFGEMRIKIELF